MAAARSRAILARPGPAAARAGRTAAATARSPPRRACAARRGRSPSRLAIASCSGTSALVVSGLAVARLGRLELALVVAAELPVPVRALGRRVERHERQLGDGLA